MYYLDTNICIYFINGKCQSLKNKILSIPPSKIRLPSIVKAELLLGAYKSSKKKENLKRLEVFFKEFEVEPFSDQTAYTYADIRSKLEKSGTLIGPNDLLIASIVLYNNGTLVTNNTKEFKRIKTLKLENWVEE